jgi:hypothetical protein
MVRTDWRLLAAVKMRTGMRMLSVLAWVLVLEVVPATRTIP